jgi:hypothetical protein
MLDTAILLSELTLGIGFLIFICRALIERLQELGMFLDREQKMDP